MGITEILTRIWLFSTNKIKSSEFFSKQLTQLIVELNLSFLHIIVTLVKNSFEKAKQLVKNMPLYKNVSKFWVV